VNSSFQLLAVLNGTAFYVLGICLATLAVGVTGWGLYNSNAFSSKAASRGLILLFLVLVLATTVFAVRYSRNEQSDRRAKLAAEEREVGATPVSGGGEVPSPDASELGGAAGPSTPPSGGEQSAAKGSGGTVKLSADPAQIAYTTKSLTSKAGKVTIDFTNPAPIQHDVAVAKGSQELAKSNLVSQGDTSVSVDLAPGKYVFYCTVPGHREAGMEGTLTVK
jgi:plastocyanin